MLSIQQRPKRKKQKESLNAGEKRLGFLSACPTSVPKEKPAYIGKGLALGMGNK